MWPLAKHKINVETLLECFSATLKIVCLDVNQELVQFHDTVFSAVSTTYLSALTRSPNRKKVGPDVPVEILFNNVISPRFLPPFYRAT